MTAKIRVRRFCVRRYADADVPHEIRWFWHCPACTDYARFSSWAAATQDAHAHGQGCWPLRFALLLAAVETLEGDLYAATDECARIANSGYRPIASAQYWQGRSSGCELAAISVSAILARHRDAVTLKSLEHVQVGAS